MFGRPNKGKVEESEKVTKQEFERITQQSVTENDFEKINFVYTYHPSISNSHGKEEISSIYISFGMRLIEDMLPTARRARSMEEFIRTCKQNYESHLTELKSNYEDFKRGII